MNTNNDNPNLLILLKKDEILFLLKKLEDIQFSGKETNLWVSTLKSLNLSLNIGDISSLEEVQIKLFPPTEEIQASNIMSAEVESEVEAL